MAIIRVWSGGTGLDPTTKAGALTTLAAAAAAVVAGDDIYVHHTSQEASLATVTYAADCQVTAVDMDNGDAYSPMGTGGWCGGNVNGSYTCAAGGKRVHIRGITVRMGGSSGGNTLVAHGGDGAHQEWEDCYFWNGGTGSATGGTSFAGGDSQTYNSLKNCTFRFSQTGTSIRPGGVMEIIGGGVDSAGSVPTTLFLPGSGNDQTGVTVDMFGFDASHAAGTTLLGSAGVTPLRMRWVQGTLPSSYTLLATQAVLNKAGAQIELVDCKSGSTTGIYAYANALGSIVKDTGTYLTAGVAGFSFRIDTTAEASARTPFTTPWLDWLDPANGSMTPRLEIATGSTLTNAQVWSEWLPKLAASVASLRSGRCLPMATPGNIPAGAGTGAWTGSVSVSGKLEPAASFTTVDDGPMAVRVGVAAPSETIYLEPAPI
jgi:hypothetical protein